MAKPTNSATFSGDVWAEVRLADAGDVPNIHRLIYQMADYYHLGDHFTATHDLLTSTLFPSPQPPPFTSFTAIVIDLSPTPLPPSASTLASRRLDLSASPITDPEAATFASPRGGGAVVTAGFTLCFPNFSTFIARPGLYVEDFFIRAPWRGHGLGRMMLSAVAGKAAELGRGRVEWTVIEWNKRSIEFYEGMGAEVVPEWRICRLTGPALDKYKGGQEKMINGMAESKSSI